MTQMVTNDESKDKPYDEISELLKKFYKPSKEINSEELWQEVSKKIDSLFHKELISDKCFDEQGDLLSEESRYWLGIEEYIKNQVSPTKHKIITDHLLQCKECRKNYNESLDKKKLINDLCFKINDSLCLSEIKSKTLIDMTLLTT